MNLLRRIASLPGVRSVLLHPGIRRRVATVLALRFLVAAWATTQPFSVPAGEVRSRGQIRTSRVRATGVPVALQHGRDMEALLELFTRGEYEPPVPLRDRLSERAVHTIADVGANVGMFSAWARGRWPQARIIAVEPAPENTVVLQEHAIATTTVRTVDWFPIFAGADLVTMDIEGGEWPILRARVGAGPGPRVAGGVRLLEAGARPRR